MLTKDALLLRSIKQKNFALLFQKIPDIDAFNSCQYFFWIWEIGAESKANQKKIWWTDDETQIFVAKDGIEGLTESWPIK